MPHFGTVNDDVAVVPATTAIPTLSEWAVILMGMMLAAAGVSRLRRRG